MAWAGAMASWQLAVTRSSFATGLSRFCLNDMCQDCGKGCIDAADVITVFVKGMPLI
jgi:hypothetical protein